MIRNIDDAFFYSMDREKGEFIKILDIPAIKDFSLVVESFHKILNQTLPSKITKGEINVITLSRESHKAVINSGFKTSFYIYDLLNFTDKGYYLHRDLPKNIYTIVESVDTIPYELIQKMYSNLPDGAYMYLFHDSNIPRKYFSVEDIEFVNKFTPYNIINWHGVETRQPAISSFILKLRDRKKNLDELTINGYKNITKSIEFHDIDIFDLSVVDINRPIITPHITIVRDLNKRIRNYLGLYDPLDECRPLVNEWLISHGPSEAFFTDNGEKIVLPIGYRLKVKEVKSSVNENNNMYIIYFDHEGINGKIKEAYVKISKGYIQYLLDGETVLPHDPNSYLYYFGYVINTFNAIHHRYDYIDVLYDYSLSNDRRDLYSSILPVRVHCNVYFSLNKRIKFTD